MSTYTVQLRYPVEQKLKEMGFPPDESEWPRVYDWLGLGDYPIYDEAHRQVLNDKIIRRYWMREIGFETMGLFRWNLRRKMFEDMPYWNDMYESLDLITDPLSSRDMYYDETWTRDEAEDATRTSTEDSTIGTTGSSNQSTDSNDRSVFQDTPMNGLDTGAIEAMDYASSVTFDKGSSKTDSTSESETRRDMNRSDRDERKGDFDGTKASHERGYDRPQAETLLTYRKAIVNIDLEIVESLSGLFMGLW